MATIRMTAQEAREYVKKNDEKLQLMYDAAPFADEGLNPDTKPITRGFASFKEYISIKKKGLKKSLVEI